MSLYECILGPSLYRIFEIPHRNYEPYSLERNANRVIRLIEIGKTIFAYVSPIVAYKFYHSILIQKDTSFVSALGQNYYSRFFMAMFSLYLASHLLRGFSRSINPTYGQFIRTFKLASTSLATANDHRDDELQRKVIEARNVIREKYDFDFKQWPIDFHWSEGRFVNQRPAKLLPLTEASHEVLNESPVVQMVSWMMAKSLGRILLYPGSLSLLQKAIQTNLVAGRHFLIETYNAKRFKLQSRDENEVDVIFIDKRSSSFNNNQNESYRGNTLVITCEGNAGFYEIGMLTTPLNCNYSVLGWNHPGFGGSTGRPYPQNEINAMESVVNFAVTKLGFKLENIIIFAWSIGGFPAAWAAYNYPELKSVMIDASFDDVLPLARSRMIPFLGPIVDSTIRNYFNLNLSPYLSHYKGPVRFIRRLRDEIIPIDPGRPIETNRINLLLIKLLASRFPNLISHTEVLDELKRYLNTENKHEILRSLDTAKLMQILMSYIETNKVESYPIEIDVDQKTVDITTAKQIILFMAREHMTDFDSTHCTPLHTSLFREPFDLFGFVKTK